MLSIRAVLASAYQGMILNEGKKGLYSFRQKIIKVLYNNRKTFPMFLWSYRNMRERLGLLTTKCEFSRFVFRISRATRNLRGRSRVFDSYSVFLAFNQSVAKAILLLNVHGK